MKWVSIFAAMGYGAAALIYAWAAVAVSPWFWIPTAAMVFASVMQVYAAKVWSDVDRINAEAEALMERYR